MKKLATKIPEEPLFWVSVSKVQGKCLILAEKSKCLVACFFSALGAGVLEELDFRYSF
jgi:hypothetical protein